MCEFEVGTYIGSILNKKLVSECIFPLTVHLICHFVVLNRPCDFSLPSSHITSDAYDDGFLLSDVMYMILLSVLENHSGHFDSLS